MLDPWFARRYPLKHLKKLFYWPIQSRVLRDARAVLFTSEEERRQASGSFFGAGYRQEVVSYGTAPPSVDLTAARERFLEAFPNLRNKRLLLFLGRLHEKKGCDLLIQAFAAVIREHPDEKDLQLVLAGPTDPNYLEQLKSMAGSLPVSFTGMLEGEAKWGAFAAAEVFVLPSHQENFGIAVAEALACGTPVLISDKVNIWREITTDEAGFAAEDTVAGTKQLLAGWLGVAPAVRKKMRENAVRCFAQRFHIDKATASLESVLVKYARTR